MSAESRRQNRVNRLYPILFGLLMGAWFLAPVWMP